MVMSIQQKRAIARARREALLRRLREQLRRRNQARKRRQPRQREINERHAFLVGINYIGTPYRLNGCINDIENINTFLSGRGFTDITMMSDDGTVKPTKEEILNGFKNLLINSQPKDLLFFHYSGHGGQIRDQQGGDEQDGKDECLYSCKLEPIRDDDLKNIIMNHMQPNRTLVCLIDACNSGTAMDLRFNYEGANRGRRPRRHMRDRITPGNVFMISGCRDTQTSADAYIGGEYAGAMTSAFIKMFRPQATWLQLLGRMQQWLKNKKFSQIPQLSSGRQLQLNFQNEL